MANSTTVYTFIHQMRADLMQDENQPGMARRAQELLDLITAHDMEVERIAREVTADCKAELAAATLPSTLTQAAATQITTAMPRLIGLSDDSANVEIAAIIEHCLSAGSES